jgi:glyoxylase-like metal-dependent hydrolase (beta-lactamase superfamily II)
VDGGPDTLNNKLFIEREMATIGRHPSEIEAMYVTHGHGDHYGIAKDLQEAYNIPVYVGQADRRAVETGNYWLSAGFFYGRFFGPVQETVAVGDGYERAVGGIILRAVEVPGHTPGSIAYELDFGDGDIIGLFGDALWGGHHPAIGSDTTVWKESIQKVLGRKLTGLSFGHGLNHIVRHVRPHLQLFQEQIETCFNAYDYVPPEYFDVVHALRAYTPEARTRQPARALWHPPVAPVPASRLIMPDFSCSRRARRAGYPAISGVLTDRAA